MAVIFDGDVVLPLGSESACPQTSGARRHSAAEPQFEFRPCERLMQI
jgi:hypothetical protein